SACDRLRRMSRASILLLFGFVVCATSHAGDPQLEQIQTRIGSATELLEIAELVGRWEWCNSPGDQWMDDIARAFLAAGQPGEAIKWIGSVGYNKIELLTEAAEAFAKEGQGAGAKSAILAAFAEGQRIHWRE